MTLLFFGSSDFSIAALRACLDSAKVLLVITTPDRRKGRGLKEAPTPVKQIAAQHNLPVVSPENLKSHELIEQAAQLKPDLFVVSSYGKMIPSSWLKIPSQLALNVHPSLLPKYRGAAPINWAILKGEPETGISIAEVTGQLDAGDIFYQKKIPLEDSFDSQSLTEKLAELSREALASVFKSIQENKELVRIKQDAALSSYAPKLKKEDGLVDWKKTAVELLNLIRGLLPWPAACMYAGTEPVQILKAGVKDRSADSGMPGTVVAIENRGTLRVQAGKGILDIEKVQPAGRKEMSGADFARGRRLQPGFLLTASSRPSDPAP